MKVASVLDILGLTSKQLELLEYDYLLVHKEYLDRVIEMGDDYEDWYVKSLEVWRDRNHRMLGITDETEKMKSEKTDKL